MDFLKKLKKRTRTDHPARERILRRFEKWLDDTLKDEPPLEGIDARVFSELTREDMFSGSSGEGTDWYSTWAAMTALTQEVRLQGRAFRDLTGKIEPLPALMTAVEEIKGQTDQALTEARQLTAQARDVFMQREKEIERETVSRVRSEFLEVLIDMRERINTGLTATREAEETLREDKKTGWFGRRRRDKNQKHTAVEIMSSLKKGYELSMERLDETLAQHGLSEIPCRGRLFDPETMSAVDVEKRHDMPDGTVMAVYRTGYTMGDDVYRPAQVKVSRMPEGAGPLSAKEDNIELK
ncbi:MAG: nucleotide exchange factor GrpE [Deltaproteobacteria bacterium]|nr:nucleotide exchange factor GrpE [Deltaproteobacteria bacterium]